MKYYFFISMLLLSTLSNYAMQRQRTPATARPGAQQEKPAWVQHLERIKATRPLTGRDHQDAFEISMATSSHADKIRQSPLHYYLFKLMFDVNGLLAEQARANEARQRRKS